jgi:hypothetical protein
MCVNQRGMLTVEMNVSPLIKLKTPSPILRTLPLYVNFAPTHQDARPTQQDMGALRVGVTFKYRGSVRSIGESPFSFSPISTNEETTEVSMSGTGT